MSHPEVKNSIKLLTGIIRTTLDQQEKESLIKVRDILIEMQVVINALDASEITD